MPPKHGDHTTNERNFDALTNERIGLGQQHSRTIQAIARSGREQASPVRILEVGCGQCRALAELKKHFPWVEYYGLDIEAPAEIPEGVQFIHQSVDAPLPDDIPKFDLVFSHATFHYVEDVRAALQNIFDHLNPNGLAIIDLEPFYLGPHSLAMLSSSGVIRWDDRHRAILMSPEFGSSRESLEEKKESIMSSYVRYDLPDEMCVNLYAIEGREREAMEIFSRYTPENLEEMRRQDPSIGESLNLKVINWRLLSFLEVRTHNESGTDGAGTEACRAFRYAARRMYLCQENLTPEEVTAILLHRPTWPDELCKEGGYDTHFSNFNREMRDVVEERIQSKLTRSNVWHIKKETLLVKYKASTIAQTLRRVAALGHEEEVNTICCYETGAIDEKDTNPKKGFTALHWALRKLNIGVALTLLNHGASCTIPDSNQQTAKDLIEELPEAIQKQFAQYLDSTSSCLWGVVGFFGVSAGAAAVGLVVGANTLSFDL